MVDIISMEQAGHAKEVWVGVSAAVAGREDKTVINLGDILNGKMLDINMSGARGRATGMNQFDGGSIVCIERRRGSLGSPSSARRERRY